MPTFHKVSLSSSFIQWQHLSLYVQSVWYKCTDYSLMKGDGKGILETGKFQSPNTRVLDAPD